MVYNREAKGVRTVAVPHIVSKYVCVCVCVCFVHVCDVRNDDADDGLFGNIVAGSRNIKYCASK